MRLTFERSISMALLAAFLLFGGCGSDQVTTSEHSTPGIALDTVKAGRFDTGKMWTFDFPPVEYFAQAYHFTPTKEWFEKARLSSLRLPGCSASFVSEDGLVMTNHHCVRGTLARIQKDGEKLVETGFYAPQPEDERKAPVWLDQLVVMDDVTKEVQAAFDSGTNDSTKNAFRTARMTEIQNRYAQQFHQKTTDSMVFMVYSFYNGGRYSLYGFKRYTDVRLVFAPEEKSAFYGGDPDNFTYPRYDFDCSFYRVYENGKPLKTANFFRFSTTGPKEGDAVFLIGNPGTTNRLLTLAQLETLRDYQYPFAINAGASRLNALNNYVERHPDQQLDYINQIFGVANSLKATKGYLSGLLDPYLWAKKVDFERSFRRAVTGDPTLKARYGNPWEAIAALETERRSIYGESSALTVAGTRSQLLNMAGRLVNKALGIPEPRMGRGGAPAAATSIFPQSFVPEIETPLLADQLAFMQRQLGTKNAAFNALLGGRTPMAAAEQIMKATVLTSKETVEALAAGTKESILNSSDPLLSFVAHTRQRGTELQARLAEIREKETIPSQSLGKAMYEVYGTSIPPDATFSLRIADGVVKGYDYNGTLAPPVTTMYGLYDRYYSFGKTSPWIPGDKWLPPPADLNLSTPLNFVSTNDAIGGNSGSPMINTNLEVIGLLFDGNIESLPGAVIYDERVNRSVGVHSAGILEGLAKVYKANRIADELRNGRMVPQGQAATK